ncbi:MAG TPA: HlyD family type I secretion periplasmic adaptor subunit [Sedimenticola sp.]|nr:HlyD family type I secretion periplasmic adaptor subunit [Sedimenticola sp.]
MRPARERDFLPAALALQERPPSPAGRSTLWLIMLFFTALVTWACFGRSDIVASARGRIVPGGYSKVIQPLEIGTVTEIRVAEGERVTAGEPLIQLDPATALADRTRIEIERENLLQENRRLRYLTGWLQQGGDQQEPEGLNERQLRLLRGQWQAHRAEIASLEAQRETRKAALGSVSQEVTKLERVLSLLTRRAEKLEQLTTRKFLGEAQYLEMEQRRIEARFDLEQSRQRITELKAEIAAIDARRLQTEKDFRSRTLQQLQETETRRRAIEQELGKAIRRLESTTLRAPVSGVVQQLAVHTIGAVVTPAQRLMVIVPDSAGVEIEALLGNRDVGFVHQGQRAEVKIDAFPYTRYGVMAATLTHLSPDALQDSRQGLVFKARLLLDGTRIRINGQDLALSPGMTVTVEFKTGNRRLIEYFLDPLLRALGESLRER